MQLAKYDAATAVPTLNRNNVHVLGAVFPPVAEQIEIAAKLDILDEVVAKQVNAFDQLQQNKAALMSHLLTGRVRVATDLLMAAE
jgi:type I restriction enzyme S subunit